MTSQQDGCTRTAGSGGLLKLGSHKQPSAAPAAYRLLPAAGEPPPLGHDNEKSNEEVITQMIKMSKVVGRYFGAWIVLDSWDSFHPLDLERFYRFVKAVVRYSRKPPPPTYLRDLIKARWKEQRQQFSVKHEKK